MFIYEMEIKSLREIKASQIVCDPGNFLIRKAGTGVVILGKHPVHGPVAIKCFKTNLERFKVVPEILVSGNHDNIARVHGWATWSKNLGLVMQYYEGGNLRDFLLSRKRYSKRCVLEPVLCLRIALQLAKALTFLHNFSSDKSLIHGALNPGSILLTADLHCKLADCSGAKLVNKPASKSTVIPKSNAFTPLFAAPEVLKATVSNCPPKPSKQQDVYSYGMLMYVVLTRNLPFGGKCNLFVLNGIFNGKRPDCSSIEKCEKRLPGSERVIISRLASVMKRCWAQSPDLRPTMLEVQNELQMLFDGLQQTFHKRSPDLDLFQRIAGAVKQQKRQSELHLRPTDQKNLVPLDSFSTRTYFTKPVPVSAVQPAKDQARPTSDVTERATQDEVVPGDKQVLEVTFHPADGDKCALNILQRYVKRVRKHKNTDLIAEEFQHLIQNHLQVTAEELRIFAIHLRELSNYIESILFFQMSSSQFANCSNSLEAVEGLRKCALGLREANVTMLGCDVTMKHVVSDCVLPLLREMRAQIELKEDLDERSRTLGVVWCLHAIEDSEGLVGELRAQKRTLKEAISLMEETFKHGAVKYKVYAYCLNSLGAVYSQTSVNKAEKCFSRALEAWKHAEDVSGEERPQFQEHVEGCLERITSKSR